METLRQTGRSNMGDVTDRMSRARFSRIGWPVTQIVAVRGTFTDAGASPDGSATLTIKKDGINGNYTLATIATIGSNGNNLHFRVPKDERDAWRLQVDPETQEPEELVLDWTDPATGDDTLWELEIDVEQALEADSATA